MKSIQVEIRSATMMVLAAALMLSACQPSTVTVTREVTREVEVTVVVTQPASPQPSPTPNQPSTPAPATTSIAPYPDAPLCPDTGEAHDNSLFHTLWDDKRGCHYDNEHGQNPFTPEVAAFFPGFDLHELLGGVEIGHTNPSSPMENTIKHGGFKWDVGMPLRGCVGGFEDAEYCVAAYAIQYHTFGNSSIELESRIHSTAALLRVCDPANLSDCGFMYVVQFQDYGQRVTPYQGEILPFPNSPVPPYNSPNGPYIAIDCVGGALIKGTASSGACRASIDQIIDRNLASNSIWTSKNTGNHPHLGSTLFNILFTLGDNYQVLEKPSDGSPLTYPFTFLYVCGGSTYNPTGCRYNNSTTTVNEVAGTVPSSWDGADFDTDPRPNRITAEGYVTKFGEWNDSCIAPSVLADCFPIKMVGMFVGHYGSELVSIKADQEPPPGTGDRDIYFCNGILCNAGDPGAVPSGWIGLNN